MERDGSLLDDYVLSLAGAARPRVCFLPTASGDADHYVVRFYRRFSPCCEASHVSLFRRDQGTGGVEDDLASHLLAQDLIYVGGGNVVSMLGAWRAHGLDAILRRAWRRGIVLCGPSAGLAVLVRAGAQRLPRRPAQRARAGPAAVLQLRPLRRRAGAPRRVSPLRRRRHAPGLRRRGRRRAAFPRHAASSASSARAPTAARSWSSHAAIASARRACGEHCDGAVRRRRAGAAPSAPGRRNDTPVEMAPPRPPRARRPPEAGRRRRGRASSRRSRHAEASRVWRRTVVDVQERQIFAMGGGGFTMEPNNPLLDDFVLSLADVARAADPVPADRLRRHERADQRVQGALRRARVRARAAVAVPPARVHALARARSCSAGHRLRRRRLDAQPARAVARARARPPARARLGSAARCSPGLSAGAMCWFQGGVTCSSGAAEPIAGLGPARRLAHRPRRRRARAAARVARRRARRHAPRRMGAGRRRRPAVPRRAPRARRQLAPGRRRAARRRDRRRAPAQAPRGRTPRRGLRRRRSAASTRPSRSCAASTACAAAPRADAADASCQVEDLRASHP